MGELRGLARKLAGYALFGGGGVGLAGGTLVALLAAEALIAKKVIGVVPGTAPEADGLYGADPSTGLPGGVAGGVPAESDDGDALSFVVLGDSTACGYGVQLPSETPGALLAEGLAALSGRTVRLSTVAVVGAETKELHEQVARALPAKPDVAVVIIGANDVTHHTSPATSVRHLVDGIRALRDAGAQVVVATCPDLGTVQPLPPPLRQIARAWSRRLAAAQEVGARAAGARTVSLGSLLGPEFAAAPAELFGPDRFHPSATGYASAAAALLPTLALSIGAWPADETDENGAPGGSGETGEALAQGAILPVSFAAAAARRAG